MVPLRIDRRSKNERRLSDSPTRTYLHHHEYHEARDLELPMELSGTHSTKTRTWRHYAPPPPPPPRALLPSGGKIYTSHSAIHSFPFATHFRQSSHVPEICSCVNKHASLIMALILRNRKSMFAFSTPTPAGTMTSMIKRRLPLCLCGK